MVRGHWALHPGWVEANLPIIGRLLLGESAGMDLGKREAITEPRIVTLSNTKFGESHTAIAAMSSYSPVYSVNYYSDISKLPMGSTVIVDVIGPITKYGGMCSYGSLEYADLTQRLDAAENVSAIIFNIDSPGGEVNGTSAFADAIKACGTRTIAWIHDGYAASAGYWIASACDEIYVSHATDMVGSIGVYCTLADYTDYFAKLGIKVYEIYAPQSTDKNGDAKAAFAGKPQAIQEDLKVIAAAFIDTVKTNRGDRLTSDEWNTGKMFYAPAAHAIGLIDGVKSLEEIMDMITAGVTTTPNNSANFNSINMFGNKLKITYGLRGQNAADISDKDLQAANDELQANGIDPGLQLARVAANSPTAAELDSANEALEAATTELETVNATLKTTNSTLATANSRITELENELKEANAKPGGLFATGKTKQDDHQADGDNEFVPEDDVDDLEHNKKADAMFGKPGPKKK